MTSVETGLVCPHCHEARLRVHMRMLKDERGQCWGECPSCGEKVKGGVLPRPLMFDAVAKVSQSCGGTR